MRDNRAVSFGLGIASATAGLAVALVVLISLATLAGFAVLPAVSIVGASITAVIAKRFSVVASIAFIVPIGFVFWILPTFLGAMSDGHPPHDWWWSWLPFAHAALSLVTLWLVPKIGSVRWQFVVPAVAILSAIVAGRLFAAGESAAIERRLQSTKEAAPMAFERDLLPQILTGPGNVAWQKPTSDRDNYLIEGNLSSGRGRVRLNTKYAYTVYYSISLSTKHDFASGSSIPTGDRTLRAKQWLQENGVAAILLQNLKATMADSWDSMLTAGMVRVFPSNGKVTIEGNASFDPVAKRFAP